MKATTNTTTKTTTATPVAESTTMTASETAAILDKVNDLTAAAVEALNNGMTEVDFVKYVSMTYFNYAADLEALKGIQADAVGAFKKAMKEKAAKEEIEKYHNLNTAERIMVKVTETIMDFCDSRIAEEINNMVYENASSVKVAAFIGKHGCDSEAMQKIKYIYNSIKDEKELSRFALTFVRVYEEICINKK